jgi:hypothetical protein
LTLNNQNRKSIKQTTIINIRKYIPEEAFAATLDALAAAVLAGVGKSSSRRPHSADSLPCSAHISANSATYVVALFVVVVVVLLLLLLLLLLCEKFNQKVVSCA